MRRKTFTQSQHRKLFVRLQYVKILTNHNRPTDHKGASFTFARVAMYVLYTEKTAPKARV